MLGLLLILGVGTGFAQDCEDWGDIVDGDGDEVTDTVYAGDSSTEIHISGADNSECPDDDDCNWALTEQGTELGILTDCAGNAPDGSPVCYTPPRTLADCKSRQVRIDLTCPHRDGVNDTTDAIVLKIVDESADCTLDYTVSGGGCISPQAGGAAWILFPLFGIGGLARRRQH